MIYAVEHGGQTTFIQAKPHRAHYVARQVAGGDDYALETVGRISEVRAASRAKRRLAERRRAFESLAEGGEG